MGKLSKIVISISVVLICVSAVAVPAADIWGSPIMKQPFDKDPLRQINVPEWVGNLDTAAYSFPQLDDATRDRAAKAGTQIGEIRFVSGSGACYDSKLLTKRDPNITPDKTDKEIAAYNKLGVRILGVVPAELVGEIYFAHPDWRRIPTDSTAIPETDPNASPSGGALCEMEPGATTSSIFSPRSRPNTPTFRRLVLMASVTPAPATARTAAMLIGRTLARKSSKPT